MASDDYLKKEGIQITDINKVIKDIFEIYKNFYERQSGRDLQRKRRKLKRPDCKYMKQEVERPWRIGRNNIPYPTKKRYDELARHLIRRVERGDFIGFLEQNITHKIAKAFRTNKVDALASTAFLTIDASFFILEIVFAGTGFSVGTEVTKKAGEAIKLPIDLSILVGQDVLGALVDGKVEFVDEKRKGKFGKWEYKKGGGKFKGDIAATLKDLDHEDSKALFNVLGRVYKYYMPKINVHFNQCHDAYEDLFKDIFKNDKEPEKDDDLEEKKPEFKTCDDLVKFTKKVYRLYHEIYKLRQYIMPMLRFMYCIAVQAKIWQEFWNDNHLWKTEEIIKKLKEFDDKKHQDCKYTYLCYGPRKNYIGPEGHPYSVPVPHAEIGPNIKVFPGNDSKPHHEIEPPIRSPWTKARREKLEDCKRKNRKTWQTTWAAAKQEKEKKEKEYQKKLKNDPELKKRAEEIKKSQREYVLNDKSNRVAQFVSAAKKSTQAKENDDGRRFEALVTDVGLFTEYKGYFGGQWRWAKHYFFNVKSKTKTTFNIVVLGAGIGAGVTIAVVTGVATAGLATPVAAGIAVGVAAAWGVLKFGTTKISDWIVDRVEGKYDKDAIEKGKDWYGRKVGGKRRMRINRNADASAKVISHCLSSIKNYKRLKYFYENGNLTNINDCDELAQYLWSVYKLQHHAWKMVEYNRPMLDFVMTCANNLERWEKRFDNHIDRCMQYSYDYVLTDDNHEESYKSHIKKCGKSYRSKAIRLMRQLYNKAKKSNTFNIDCRKSRFCYGPKRLSLTSTTAEPHECALRPLDLRVDVFKKDTKRKKVRERLKLIKQGEEQQATQALSNTQVVVDDEEDE